MNGLLGEADMRNIKSILVASTVFFAAASTAQADDLTSVFSGVKNGTVTVGNTTVAIPLDAAGQVSGFYSSGGSGGSGGSGKAIVSLSSTLATFESGTAAAGVTAQSYSQSGVDILFTKTGDGTIALTDFTSTITPAGMGFYVQDRSLAPTGSGRNSR